jgi:hypothetical protein
MVKVFPANSRGINPWQVIIPGKIMAHDFTGENSEAEAFRVAVEYINRDD